MDTLPRDLQTLLVTNHLGLISSVRFALTSRSTYFTLRKLLKRRKEIATAWLKKYIVPRVDLNRHFGACVSTENDVKSRCLHGFGFVPPGPVQNPVLRDGTLVRMVDMIDYVLLVDKTTGRLRRGRSDLIMRYSPSGGIDYRYAGTVTLDSLRPMTLPVDGMVLNRNRIISNLRPLVIGRFLHADIRVKIRSTRMTWQLFADDPSIKIVIEGGIGTIVRESVVCT